MKVIYESYLRRNRNNNNNGQQQQQQHQAQLQQQHQPSKLEICHPNHFNDKGDGDPYLILFDSLQLNKELGVGEFGVVKQGVWTNNEGRCTQVAIKCLSPSRLENSKESFLKEASIMHGISHEHIVKLYGVVLNPSIMLVTELAPLRSLLECLKEPSLVHSFPVSSLCTFASQIAEGMAYLESRRLIHRDLAARNILVFNKNKVKISDFGLSRALGVGKDYYQSNFNVNLKLPIAWCAPECINYLKFTSQSDVWAYGVTLWEVFSFGFQPWAALTGQQILQAIDQPNLQRLEQPECCPKEYYQLMLKCWSHEERQRPKFAEIVKMQPDLKPELLQAIRPSSMQTANRVECLKYKVSDIITVLDKRIETDGDNIFWKGVTNDRKTGFFNPNDFVAYLGLNLPSTSISSSCTSTSSTSFVSQLLGSSSSGNGNHSSSHHKLASTITSTVLSSSKFLRGFLESKSSSSATASPHGSRKQKLRVEMISKPQGDLKHTGHIGADGVYFGNVAFIDNKQQQQQQQACKSDAMAEAKSKHRLSTLDKNPVAQFNGRSSFDHDENDRTDMQENHEYLEICEEEDLKPLESPPFEVIDLGPSLMEEVFRELHHIKPDLETCETETAINENGMNVKNEVKELNLKLSKDSAHNNSKRKQLTVKEISVSEKNELDSAIAMAKDLVSRTMHDNDEDLPKTPNSPNKRMFSFKLPSHHHHKSSPKNGRRTFSEETESIGDIIESITPAAKEAYITLVDKGVASCVNKNSEQSSTIKRPEVKPPLPPVAKTATALPPEAQANGSQSQATELEESNPLRMLRSTGMDSVLRPKVRGNRSFSQPRLPTTAGLARVASSRPQIGEQEVNNNNNNALPLPPRDRSRPLPHLKTHQRRHPLMIPAELMDAGEGVNGSGKEHYDVARHDSPPMAHRPFPVLKQVSCPLPPAAFLNGYNNRSNNNNNCDTNNALACNDRNSFLSDDFTESFESEIQKAFDNIKLNNEKIAPSNGNGDTTVNQCSINEQSLASNHYDKLSVAHSTMNNTNQDEVEYVHNGGSNLLNNTFNEGQVAVMQNVLTEGNNKVNISNEECSRLLNTIGYDVNKAIKIVRLRQELGGHNIQVDCDLVAMLEQFKWDRRQVANYLIATQGAQAETTEV